jgi:hypothetical protein
MRLVPNNWSRGVRGEALLRALPHFTQKPAHGAGFLLSQLP